MVSQCYEGALPLSYISSSVFLYESLCVLGALTLTGGWEGSGKTQFHSSLPHF